MENLILPVLALLLFVCSAGAEVVDSVMFNPSRLGQYERLKVTEELFSAGGVAAQGVSIQSGGTVSVENAGNYKITEAAAQGTVRMTQTQFDTPALQLLGGTASFERTDGESSALKLEDENAVLKLKANVLRVSGVAVAGADSALPLYDAKTQNALTGFKLGGNEIKPNANCNGLIWASRKADDGNVYRVLAMKSCTQAVECASPNESEACCTKLGYKWDSNYDECVQTCQGYTLASEDLQFCRNQQCTSKSAGSATFWNNTSSYGPFYYITQKYGSCQEGEGSSQSNTPDWGYHVITAQYDSQAALSSIWREKNGVTCEYQRSSGSMDPITPSQNTCVVYLNHVYLNSSGITYTAEPPYGAGILSCEWKETTWTCPAVYSRCGEEPDQCL